MSKVIIIIIGEDTCSASEESYQSVISALPEDAVVHVRDSLTGPEAFAKATCTGVLTYSPDPTKGMFTNQVLNKTMIDAAVASAAALGLDNVECHVWRSPDGTDLRRILGMVKLAEEAGAEIIYYDA